MHRSSVTRAMTISKELKMHAKPVRSSLSRVLLLLPVFAMAQDDERLITIDDILAMKSIGDPQVSPDGELVAYTVRQRDLKKTNRRRKSGLLQHPAATRFR